MKHRFPIALLCAVALVALAYLPAALSNQYVWDDWDLFVFSRGLHDPALLWQTLFSPVLPETSYLRPAVLATFAAEFQLWGLDTRLSHTINLALHLLNVCLVGFLGKTLCERNNVQIAWIPASIAALLYGVHPALVESTAWAAGRFDLMVTTFSIGAVLAFLSPRLAVRTAGAAVLFFLAALSKESAVAVPIVMALLYVALNRDVPLLALPKRVLTSLELAPFAAVFFAGVVYLAVRASALDQMLHVDAKVSGGLNTAAERLGFAGQTLIHYVKASVLPFTNISPMHPFDASAMTGMQIGLGIAALAAAVAGIAATLRFRQMEMALVASWFACLLPVLNLLPITISENIGHDRFLAMPLAFGSVAIGMLFSRVAASMDLPRTLKPAFAATLVGWVAISWIATKSAVPLWSSDVALWTWAYGKHPDSMYVSNNLAGTLVNAGRYADALKVLGEEPTPARPDREMNRARIQLKQGDLDAATGTLDSITSRIESIASKPFPTDGGSGFLANRLVIIYIQTRAEVLIEAKDFAGALEWIDRLKSVAPRYAHVYRLKSRAFAGLGDWAASERELKTTMSLVPAEFVEADSRSYSEFIAALCVSGDEGACLRAK